MRIGVTRGMYWENLLLYLLSKNCQLAIDDDAEMLKWDEYPVIEEL